VATNPTTLRVRCCNREQWLNALMNPRCQLTLQVCRYLHRKGVFGVDLRVLNEHLITFVEHGVLLAKVDRRDLRIPAGSAIWIPPGSQHRYCGSAGPGGVRQYNLRFRLLKDGCHFAFQRQPLLVRNAWEIQALLQMIGSLDAQHDDFFPQRLRGLLLSLVSTLFSNAGRRHQDERILRPAQRQRLASYVAMHAAEGISPADLAAEVQLSSDYFARIFRATYGQPPRTWLKTERMRLAAIQLRDADCSAKQIAYELGIRNVALFHRQFRDVIGCTPGEYRRRERPLTVTA
jgi:AraC-like DNA-binding protein